MKIFAIGLICINCGLRVFSFYSFAQRPPLKLSGRKDTSNPVNFWFPKQSWWWKNPHNFFHPSCERAIKLFVCLIFVVGGWGWGWGWTWLKHQEITLSQLLTCLEKPKRLHFAQSWCNFNPLWQLTRLSWESCHSKLKSKNKKHPATSLQALLLDVPRKVSGYKPLSLTSPFQFCSTQKNGLQYYKTVPHIINHVSFHLLSTTERESTGLGASYKWEILQRYAQNQVTLLTTLHLLAELTNQRVENWRNWNCLQRYFKSRNSPVSSFISRVAFP